jgi:hypothetical protein
MASYPGVLVNSFPSPPLVAAIPRIRAVCLYRGVVTKASHEARQASDGPGRAIGCPDLYNMTEAINQINDAATGLTNQNNTTATTTTASSSKNSSTGFDDTGAPQSVKDGTRKADKTPVNMRAVTSDDRHFLISLLTVFLPATARRQARLRPLQRMYLEVVITMRGW